MTSPRRPRPRPLSAYGGFNCFPLPFVHYHRDGPVEEPQEDTERDLLEPRRGCENHHRDGGVPTGAAAADTGRRRHDDGVNRRGGRPCVGECRRVEDVRGGKQVEVPMAAP